MWNPVVLKRESQTLKKITPVITRNCWILLVHLWVIAGCAQVPQEREPEDSEFAETSIVVILADDLGWADISCQGSAWETPAIDQLAREGIRFTRAYSNGPNCAPSRACLITGTDVATHGVFTVPPSTRGKAENRKLNPPKSRRVLRDEAVTLAEMLSEKGYRSGHIGKWHVGDDPRSQGFEVSIASDRRGYPKTHLAPWNLPDLPEQEAGTELADALTDHAVEFIEESGDEPFFLMLSHYAVHTPVQAPQKQIQKWKEKFPEASKRVWKYAALVESLDRSVQRIRDVLERTGRSKNTLVLFTSDNGGLESFTDNGPLRGGKGMLYEGGIRVPLIAWGAGLKGGRINSTDSVQLTDLAPTFLELAGASAPEPELLVGTSLNPVLFQQGALPERDLMWHFPAYLEGIRSIHGTWRTTPVSSMMRGDDKLLEFFEDGDLQLYDLKDPTEQIDLSAQDPNKVKDLRERLQRWRAARKMPMPSGPKDQ